MSAHAKALGIGARSAWSSRECWRANGHHPGLVHKRAVRRVHQADDAGSTLQGRSRGEEGSAVARTKLGQLRDSPDSNPARSAACNSCPVPAPGINTHACPSRSSQGKAVAKMPLRIEVSCWRARASAHTDRCTARTPSRDICTVTCWPSNQPDASVECLRCGQLSGASAEYAPIAAPAQNQRDIEAAWPWQLAGRRPLVAAAGYQSS